MLRNVIAAICLTIGFVAAATAKPAESAPQKWEPAGKWVIDFADQQCTAAHSFNSDGRVVNLAVRPRPTTPNVTVLFETQGTGKNFDFVPARVEFGSHKLSVEYLSVMPSSKAGFVIYTFGTDQEGLAELASGQQLKVSFRGIKLDLPVTELNSVMKVLDRCVADLLTHWGLSEQDQARLVNFPVPERNVASYVSNGDYPSSALARCAMGQVEARVTISPNGRASDCRMIRSSGHEDLDEVTCSLVIKKARFEPAHDREGKAMTSPFLFAMRWLIPSL